MKLNLRKRKQYKHEDIQKMLKDPKRQSQPFSYLHPQISPSGANFMEDDDALAVVSDAKRRYISNGWMPNRRTSEQAETKRDITALMSLEGTLTAAIHNAIHPGMFDSDEAKKSLPGMRSRPPIDREPFGKWHERNVTENIGRLGAIRGEAGHGSVEAHHIAVQKLWLGRSAEKEGPERVAELEDYNTKPLPLPPDVPDEKHEDIAEEAFTGSGLLISDSPAKKPKHKVKPPHGSKATSQGEHQTEAQETTIPETEPERPTVDQDNGNEKEEIGTTQKKSRQTKKKTYRTECETCGIKWRKSWNTAKLKEKIDSYNINKDVQ